MTEEKVTFMLYKNKSPLIIFLLPGILLMIIFLYEPFIENVINSFFDITSFIKMNKQSVTYIGFENYKKLFLDPKIRIAIFNSIKMMILTLVFQVGIGFILAVLVSYLKYGQKFFRTVYFFPIVISATAIGLIFKLFYNYNGGMLNQLLINMGEKPVNWLSPSLAFIMISIPTLWSYIGFYFVIILTGLNDIPEDIYDAAKVDGCTGVRQVFYISIPLIKSILCTCITLGVTGALKVFDLPWIIVPKGAPRGLTHFLGTYMYEQTFTIGNIDYGSAIALIIVVFGVLISLIISRLLKPDDSI
jgi:raffinose/stachyose/melibiose transport system permease protein